MIHRGDTFINGQPTILSASGASTAAPRLIATYGAGTIRPIFLVDAQHSKNAAVYCSNARTCGDFTAIIGIDFYAYTRDPANPHFNLSDVGQATNGIRSVNDRLPKHWFLIEDCVIRFFGEGVSWSPVSGATSDASVQLRRNVIVNNYSGIAGTHSQGVFLASVNHVLLEENLLDSNGWNPTLSAPASTTIASSNGLIQINWDKNKLKNGDFVAFDQGGGNIVANRDYCVSNLSGSIFNLRAAAGNTCSGSVIPYKGTEISPQHAEWTVASKNIFNRNVYLHQSLGTDVAFIGNISTNSSSAGVQMRTGGKLENNYFDGGTFGFQFGCTGDKGCVMRSYGYAHRNVVMHSNDSAFGSSVGIGMQVENFASFIGLQNIFAHRSSSGKNSAIVLTRTTSNSKISENVICDWGPSRGTYVFDLGSNNMVDGNRLSTSCSFSGDAGSYFGLIGGSPATLNGFIAAARIRGVGVWDPKLSANAVNTYIRSSIGLH